MSKSKKIFKILKKVLAILKGVGYYYRSSKGTKKKAGVSELADETDSKSVIHPGVWVRVPPPALNDICVRYRDRKY